MIDSLSRVLSISKCIHERDAEGLRILLEPKVDDSILGKIKEWIGLGNDFYNKFLLLPPIQKGEMTFLTESEFAHYPFLAPFKYKDLQYITSAIREKLEEMPTHSATVLGTIPVALTKSQIDAMGLVIEEPEAIDKPVELYLFNIAIITAGNHTITFVPKQVKSGIDISYPIIKYKMHNGLLYQSANEQDRDNNGADQLPPSLESRKNLYLNHFGFYSPPLAA